MATSSSPARLPGIKHNVIGLVSGGKDSTFNLLHCIANGHDIVALATLTPQAGVDELDSHMYQSVGTGLLPLIAQSIGVPLHTRVIEGKSIAQGAEYGSRLAAGGDSGVLGDETEDLYRLLQHIKHVHPESTAVASGAILSNYQRLRIEHVCQRLGLVSLSYLWQAEQLPLLDSMAHAGMDVVLVKVAGIGLGVPLVGRRLFEVLPLLRRLEQQYGSHPAGEGGEYETITLSNPLFSRRLELHDTEVIVTDPEPYPVAYLKVHKAELVPIENWEKPSQSSLRYLLKLPPAGTFDDGLDEESKRLILEGSSLDQSSAVPLPQDPLSDSEPVRSLDDMNIRAGPSSTRPRLRLRRKDRTWAASISGVTHEAASIGEEITQCFDILSAELLAKGLSLPLQACHITLLLSSMSLFSEANKVYSTYFGTSPPSRATVAVPLPSGERVRIEVIGDEGQSPESADGESDRRALHVQSLSYWAPANIGPYSQAVTVNGRVHVAGQVPLLPASLSIPALPTPPGDVYQFQSVLALQHVRRIRDILRSKQSTGGGWEGWLESCTAWWVWHDDYGAFAEAAILSTWQTWARSVECEKSPVAFLRAKQLPRDSLVEFQTNWHTGRRSRNLAPASISGDHNDDDVNPVFSTGTNSEIAWETSRTTDDQDGSRGFIFIRDCGSSPSIPPALQALVQRAVSIKAYHLSAKSVEKVLEIIEAISNSSSPIATPCLSAVPVSNIANRYGHHFQACLEIFV